MMPQLTIGSLFSGIGGLELGLERALGATVAWQVELDPFCRRVLAKHWPAADRSVCDVRNAGVATLPRVDLVCGGFPCQDISVAGAGAGLSGAKSGLWFDFRRVVEELRPLAVVIENVPALRTRGLGVVLEGLAALGYDAEWGVLSAAAVGAPHLRKRLFVVAWRATADTNGIRQLQQEGVVPELWGRAGDSGCPCDAWAAEPSVGGTADGLPVGLDRPVAHWERGVARVAHKVKARADRLRALGNAVVPQVAYQVGLVLRDVLERLACRQPGTCLAPQARCLTQRPTV